MKLVLVGAVVKSRLREVTMLYEMRRQRTQHQLHGSLLPNGVGSAVSKKIHVHYNFFQFSSIVILEKALRKLIEIANQ